MVIKALKIGKRRLGSHKGMNGSIVVIAGSDSYPGAAYLAGMAAYRTGVDNVTIAAPIKVAWAINRLSPDIMTVKMPGGFLSVRHAKQLLKMSENFDVVLIGNGMGLNERTKKLCRILAAKISAPKVIDADAIKSVRLQDVKNSILTPHRKEFEILLKNSKCGEANVQQNMGNNIILLKGPVDRIFSKNKIALNRAGNAGMTVSGTGDVLAGITAGLLAITHDAWKSARLAAFINGKIGDKLLKVHGYGFVASDFLSMIGCEVYRYNA